MTQNIEDTLTNSILHSLSAHLLILCKIKVIVGGVFFPTNLLRNRGEIWKLREL